MMGLASPHPPSWVPLLASCSVSACCLRRTLWLLGLVAFVLCAFGSAPDTVHVAVFGGFWLLFHKFQCEGEMTSGFFPVLVCFVRQC